MPDAQRFSISTGHARFPIQHPPSQFLGSTQIKPKVRPLTMTKNPFYPLFDELQKLTEALQQRQERVKEATKSLNPNNAPPEDQDSMFALDLDMLYFSILYGKISKLEKHYQRLDMADSIRLDIELLMTKVTAAMEAEDECAQDETFVYKSAVSISDFWIRSMDDMDLSLVDCEHFLRDVGGE
ncbi:hypothetical protein B0O80DRAFT_499797 [Mortierella sp. GBAus27b]|nr:hypothetical protein BGX31_003279 [Mortierella sp. GBA43]KAI8351881.1 hypothetical protein B0O80DRAFT_499797 [Mortierella sp. GBAus27b]